MLHPLKQLKNKASQNIRSFAWSAKIRSRKINFRETRKARDLTQSRAFLFAYRHVQNISKNTFQISIGSINGSITHAPSTSLWPIFVKMASYASLNLLSSHSAITSASPASRPSKSLPSGVLTSLTIMISPTIGSP